MKTQEAVETTSRASRLKWTPLIGAILLFGVAAAGIFARSMNYELTRDEQLYVPPAALLGEFALYEDFFYNHVPGSAWIYRLFYQAFGDGGLLFSARLAVFAAWVGFAAVFAFFAWRLARSGLATAAILILALTNEQLLGVVGSTASNNFLPLPLAAAGLFLFSYGAAGRRIRGDLGPSLRSDPNSGLIAAAGVMLAAAASIKVSAIAFAIPVAIGACFIPSGLTWLRRLRVSFAPLAAGGVLGAMPVLVEFLKAPHRFLAHVVQYHTGPHAAYWRSDPAEEADVAMGLADKVLLAHQLWFSGATLVLCLLAGVLMAMLACSREWDKARDKAGDSDIEIAVLLLIVVAFVLGFSFLPTPAFPQYFAPALAAAPILIAVLFAKVAEDNRRLATAVLVVAALFSIGAGAPRIAQHLPKLARPEAWTVMRVHQDGLSIAQALHQAGVSGKVATLLPIYPLEGGLAVYPELATGQFAYRTAEFTRPELLKFYRATSPGGVNALLAADPPAALLLGFEPELEAPMAAFAVENGYSAADSVKIVNKYGEGRLWVRSKSAD